MWPTLVWAMPNKKARGYKIYEHPLGHLNTHSDFLWSEKVSWKEKMVALGPGPTSHCLTQADEVHPDVDGCRWQPRRPLPGRTPKRRWRTSDGRSSRTTMSVCEKHCTTGISLQVKTKTYPERKKLDTLKGKKLDTLKGKSLDISWELISFHRKTKLLRQRFVSHLV